MSGLRQPFSVTTGMTAIVEIDPLPRRSANHDASRAIVAALTAVVWKPSATTGSASARAWRVLNPLIPIRVFARNVMTVSEYEERFRASAPSLHETFTEMRGPSRGRWLMRRLGTAAVLAGAVIAAVEAASHHAADNFMASALKTWQFDAQ